jgi:hypothetical protein
VIWNGQIKTLPILELCKEIMPTNKPLVQHVKPLVCWWINQGASLWQKFFQVQWCPNCPVYIDQPFLKQMICQLYKPVIKQQIKTLILASFTVLEKTFPIIHPLDFDTLVKYPSWNPFLCKDQQKSQRKPNQFRPRDTKIPSSYELARFAKYMSVQSNYCVRWSSFFAIDGLITNIRTQQSYIAQQIVRHMFATIPNIEYYLKWNFNDNECSVYCITQEYIRQTVKRYFYSDLCQLIMEYVEGYP